MCRTRAHPAEGTTRRSTWGPQAFEKLPAKRGPSKRPASLGGRVALAPHAVLLKGQGRSRGDGPDSAPRGGFPSVTAQLEHFRPSPLQETQLAHGTVRANSPRVSTTTSFLSKDEEPRMLSGSATLPPSREVPHETQTQGSGREGTTQARDPRPPVPAEFLPASRSRAPGTLTQILLRESSGPGAFAYTAVHHPQVHADLHATARLEERCLEGKMAQWPGTNSGA